MMLNHENLCSKQKGEDRLPSKMRRKKMKFQPEEVVNVNRYITGTTYTARRQMPVNLSTPGEYIENYRELNQEYTTSTFTYDCELIIRRMIIPSITYDTSYTIQPYTIVHKAVRTAMLNELEIILFGMLTNKIGNLYTELPFEFYKAEDINKLLDVKCVEAYIEADTTRPGVADREYLAQTQTKQLFVHLLCMAYHVKSLMNQDTITLSIKHFIESKAPAQFGQLFTHWTCLHRGQIEMSTSDMIKFNQLYLKTQIMKGQVEKEPTIDYNLIVDKMIDMFQGNTRMHPLDSPIRSPTTPLPIPQAPCPIMTIPVISMCEKKQASSSSSGNNYESAKPFSKNAMILSSIPNPPLVSELSQDGGIPLPVTPDLQYKLSGMNLPNDIFCWLRSDSHMFSKQAPYGEFAYDNLKQVPLRNQSRSFVINDSIFESSH